jgi:hypothetical protein
MDQKWIPASLHTTFREVLAFHLRVTLRNYYAWAAVEALKRMDRGGVRRVAEVGAGSAGFAETLAALIQNKHKKAVVEVSDLRPNEARYRELEAAFPGIIRARLDPIDFMRAPAHPSDTLVVMSAAFHHVPPAERASVLSALAGRKVLVFESVTRNTLSMLGCLIGCLPALLTPLYFFRMASGRWRRFFWCWVIPAAPVMVAWDGVVSCLRCWTDEEWRQQLRALGVKSESVSIERRGLSHMVSW